MSDTPTPIQTSLLIDGQQVDPSLVALPPAETAERAVLGSRAIGAAALSEVASRLAIDLGTSDRSISGLSPTSSARETDAVASQVADSVRRTQHRANGRTGSRR